MHVIFLLFSDFYMENYVHGTVIKNLKKTSIKEQEHNQTRSLVRFVDWGTLNIVDNSKLHQINDDMAIVSQTPFLAVRYRSVDCKID